MIKDHVTIVRLHHCNSIECRLDWRDPEERTALQAARAVYVHRDGVYSTV